MSEKVVILDDDLDMGTVLCEALLRCLKVECVTYTSLWELQKANGSLDHCALIFLDVNLGPGRPTGLDAHAWLQASGFKGKICFLTAHARNHPLVAEAALKGAEIFEKPLSMDKFCSIVQKVVRAG